MLCLVEMNVPAATQCAAALRRVRRAGLIMVGFAASVSLLVRHWKAILAWQAAEEPELEEVGQPLLQQVCFHSHLRITPCSAHSCSLQPRLLLLIRTS